MLLSLLVLSLENSVEDGFDASILPELLVFVFIVQLEGELVAA